jgi:hypothetical protein
MALRVSEGDEEGAGRYVYEPLPEGAELVAAEQVLDVAWPPRPPKYDVSE